MNRLERITAILLLLQSRKKITAQYLATHFQTSVRTIYRDVRVLEEAGVPIGAEAGVGYFLAEGYSLPPVMFTKQEAAALITGEKLVQQFADISVNKHFASALTKVRAVLRSTEKDYVETLEQNITVYRMRSNNQAFDEFPNSFMSEIQTALVNKQVIELEYFAQHSNSTNKRTIESIGLSFINGYWHLFAWCRLRKEPRDFRVDRIKQLNLLAEKYSTKHHPSLETMAKSFFEPNEMQRIVLHVKADGYSQLGDLKYYLGLVDEVKYAKYHEMVFYYAPLTQFAKWMLMWGDLVTIVEPKELKALVVKQTQTLAKLYLS